MAPIRRALFAGLAVATAAAVLSPAARAGVGDSVPVLHEELVAGGYRWLPAPAVAPTPKVLDGAIGDWTGTATRFGGHTTVSHGELVATDYLFDAYGADDGDDARREATTFGPTRATAPEAYRAEALFRADPAGQLGVPSPDQLKGEEQYGDLPYVESADLHEVRLARSGGQWWMLARTTTMVDPAAAAILVLVDRDAPPSTDQLGFSRPVPFDSGLTTSAADVALLLTAAGGRAVDLGTGATSTFPVAVDASGDINAVEAAIPAGLVGTGHVRFAVAAGRANSTGDGLADLGGPGPRLANVAFRQEPVRTWFDRDQAFALEQGSIDRFLLRPPAAADLEAGLTVTHDPLPGYHERTMVSSGAISNESGFDGILQPYGLFLPSASFDSSAPLPLSYWLHWRGGKTHSAAAVAPRIFRDQGEAHDTIVVAPRGRGTSSWYLGRGMVDVDEVFADVTSLQSVDLDRVYTSGHSMGGWGSYLLALLRPDRFAATFPVAGPVTQGAWTGVDFAGCDSYRYDDYGLCYVQTNGGDARTQHTRKLLENLRNVPTVIFQGGADELVPTSGVTRQVERLVELGYRHRYYLFPNHEHYTHPVMDEWAEGARYAHGFTRDRNPARVSYVRDMGFERTVETGPSQESPVTGLSFDFDRAYWMSELTPADPVAGQARFEGRNLARPGASGQPALRPEAGGPAAPGQAGPYAMTGLAWAPPAPAAAVNGFEVDLVGATRVRLDLTAMGLTTAPAPATGRVTADRPVTLRLDGGWASAPTVTVGGVPAAPVAFAAGVVDIAVPAGTTTITVAG